MCRALVMAGLVASALFDVTDRRSYTIALPAGRSLSVALTVGHLRIQGEPRADAVIDVARTAPSTAALSRIPVDVEETATAVRVVGTQLIAGADPALKTDVTIRVPRAAVLDELRVMEGRITLTDLAGAVTADLRRGPIVATNLQGKVRLETGIGDVVATGMRLSPDGVIRLRTFNGDVRLTLAERPANARVMALALNGTIESEIPLTLKNTWGPRWGEATLGTGEPVISLDVVTGEIDIRTK